MTTHTLRLDVPLLMMEAAGGGALGAAVAAPAEDVALRDDLARLREVRVLFGHQSVGTNVLAGLSALAREAGVAVPVMEVRAGEPVPGGTIGHLLVGENGRPASKLAAFAAALGDPARAPDLALVKLCYVDLSADTDAAALFASYQETLARLPARYPRTTFVPVTAPLTTVQTGPRALVKSLLGRAPAGVAENERREAFNVLLRGAYADQAIFDLARVESTRPDGTPERTAWHGQVVPALVPAYTGDGGHLNADGQRRAARALLRTLAAAARARR
jgi:hypothetical protein